MFFFKNPSEFRKVYLASHSLSAWGGESSDNLSPLISPSQPADPGRRGFTTPSLPPTPPSPGQLSAAVSAKSRGPQAESGAVSQILLFEEDADAPRGPRRAGCHWGLFIAQGPGPFLQPQDHRQGEKNDPAALHSSSSPGAAASSWFQGRGGSIKLKGLKLKHQLPGKSAVSRGYRKLLTKQQ